MTNRKIPRIRFKGFTDDWEQRKVSDVAEIITGGTPSTKVPEYWNPPEVSWLSSGEVHKKYITDTDTMISQKGFENSSAQFVKENSVLIALAGQGKTRGTVAINRIPLTTNQSIAAMTFNSEMYPDFVFSNLESRYEELRSISSGDGSRGGLNKQLVGDVIIPCPAFEEQKAIGDFFNDLNNLITLHQREYEKLQIIKKSMLENCFPKNGERVPRIRFSGFTGDWEQRKLDSVTDVRDGTHASPQYIDVGHPLITSKNVKNGYINYDDVQMISDTDFEEINRRSAVNVNDILMGMIGTIGNLALIREEPDFAIKNVALIKDTGQIDYCYLYGCLQSPYITHQLDNGQDGGTQKFIALNKIRELEVPLPSDEEQHKIGYFFDDLDRLITLHQRKLDKLQKMKKSMLGQMFV